MSTPGACSRWLAFGVRRNTFTCARQPDDSLGFGRGRGDRRRRSREQPDGDRFYQRRGEHASRAQRPRDARDRAARGVGPPRRFGAQPFHAGRALVRGQHSRAHRRDGIRRSRGRLGASRLGGNTRGGRARAPKSSSTCAVPRLHRRRISRTCSRRRGSIAHSSLAPFADRGAGIATIPACPVASTRPPRVGARWPRVALRQAHRPPSRALCFSSIQRARFQCWRRRCRPPGLA